MTMSIRLAALAALTLATAAPAQAPSIALPTVTGPIAENAQGGAAYRGSSVQPTTGPGLPLPVLDPFGYVQEEYFISGTVDGKPYMTSMLVRKPKDARKFSGVIGVETIHAGGAIPFWGIGSEVWMQGGHVWIAVASQRTSLENHVKRFNPARYTTLQIPQVGPPPAAPGAAPVAVPPGQMTQDMFSQGIMTQVGAFLKSNSGNGPVAGLKVRYLLMGGSSQTGGTTSNYIMQSHAKARLANGKPIWDGYMPTSNLPREPLAGGDAAIVHIVTEGDVVGALRAKRPIGSRGDSDARNDRYRHYQVVGGSHVPTRGSAKSAAPPGYPSQFPSAPLYKAALINLIDWVTRGVSPPKGARIEVANGEVVRDEHGNARGGIRSAYVDVPAVKYITSRPPIEGDQASAQVRNQQGIQEALPPETLRRLYPSRADYLRRFNRGIDRMVGGRWIVRADGDKLKAEEAKNPPV